MATTPITIEVDAEAAEAYAAATPEDRKKIQLLLSLRLRDIALKPRRSLEEIMDEMGEYAAARGMTPEILESILDEREDLQWQLRP